MNISDEIKKNHGHLSKTSLKFLEFVEKNPGALKRSQYDSLQWPYRKLLFQPWPLFINQHLKKEAMAASLGVFNLITQIPRKIFNFDPGQMAQYYEIPREPIDYIMSGVTEGHIHHLLGRGDYLYSPSHGFKCLEYNIAGNLGGWEFPFWLDMHKNTPPTAKFLKETHPEIINENPVAVALKLFINRVLQQFPHHGNEINTAMVMEGHQDGTTGSPLESYAVSMYREILQSINKKIHGELIVCDYKHLIEKENSIYYKGKRILCLHENYAGVVPEEILKAYRRGNLILYVGPLTLLMSNKLNIALLSEHEDSERFTPEERENIKKYIPWTRKTAPGQTRFHEETINLEPFVKNHRTKLVLKPALSYGGKDILIGIHTPPEQWEKAVENAFRKKIWLVQEYIQSSSYLFQEGEEGYSEHHVVWGIFVFGGTYAGIYLRTLPANNSKGVINGHQGAGISVAFEVRE